jgi:hypothetical protein
MAAFLGIELVHPPDLAALESFAASTAAAAPRLVLPPLSVRGSTSPVLAPLAAAAAVVPPAAEQLTILRETATSRQPELLQPELAQLRQAAALERRRFAEARAAAEEEVRLHDVEWALVQKGTNWLIEG